MKWFNYISAFLAIILVGLITFISISTQDSKKYFAGFEIIFPVFALVALVFTTVLTNGVYFINREVKRGDFSNSRTFNLSIVGGILLMLLIIRFLGVNLISLGFIILLFIAWYRWLRAKNAGGQIK